LSVPSRFFARFRKFVIYKLAVADNPADDSSKADKPEVDAKINEENVADLKKPDALDQPGVQPGRCMRGNRYIMLPVSSIQRRQRSQLYR
jgi:hypothetical protein